MRQTWPAVRWTLDKVLRLAAAATALVAIPTALIGGLAVYIAGNTLSLIASLSIMVFGVSFALFLLLASLGFWPDRSPNSKGLRKPALIVVSIIYLAGTCGIGFAGATLWGIVYVKSHTHLAVRNEEAK
jgi:hypothetical protein